MATLNAIFGPCGAGKTTYAHAFARREGAAAFILDDWMARLFGPDMPQPLEYEWMLERVGRCEAQIWSVAAATIAAGTPVILDIGLMRRADRERVRQIAEAVDQICASQRATRSTSQGYSTCCGMSGAKRRAIHSSSTKATAPSRRAKAWA